ncbi:MAG: glycoside hydrolase family 127 protein [Planctomycetia bacterium]|nr:glycoside hydrolase family 127 protein [Planctomycetia bacterium]
MSRIACRKWIQKIFVCLVVVIVTGGSWGSAEEPVRKNIRTLHEIPFTDVKLTEGFWASRIETNRVTSLPHNFRQCEETGRFSNFAKAAGLMEGEFEGIYFNDSDVYKVLEGASYSLAAHPDPQLEKQVDEVIAWIAAAQQPDGYLNSYYTLKEPDRKWTNTAAMHELYCAGHLFEGAVAHYRATGKRDFLDVAIRLADCIDRRFGEGKVYDVPGHEEIELALVKLYEVTGEERYLKLAEFFLNQRGNSTHRRLFGEYCQDHIPLREQRTIAGHAVRAMYLYSGTADVAGYTKDPGFMETMNAIWEDVAHRQMYITGGIGALAQNEGFGAQYELPNASAYCETCAAIGLTFWAHRMNLTTGDARYADIMEKCLYNGVLSGVSLDGTGFFYVNPLQSNGNHHRQPFFGCACCPSNVVRFVPSVPGYMYAQDAEDQVYVNLFDSGKATLSVKGTTVTIEQKTNYPWDDDLQLAVSAEKAVEFPLYIRIPGWSGSGKGGEGAETGGPASKTEQGYIRSVISCDPETPTVLDFPDLFQMAPCRMEANPLVTADRGRVAIQNGPVVYCLESCYNGGARVANVILPLEPEFQVEYRADLLGGVNVITFNDVDGKRWTATPYHVWDHGEPGQMIVWLRQKGKTIVDPASDASVLHGWEGTLYRELRSSTLDPELELTDAELTEYEASYCNGGDSVEAVCDGLEPSDSNDHSIPRMTWWSRLGSTEWISVIFPKAREIRGCDVYWFDDTARGGGCRVPRSWKIRYQNEQGEWTDVTGASTYSVKPDQYNAVSFDPVTTSGVRLEVQLQPEKSGGVLEWKFR